MSVHLRHTTSRRGALPVAVATATAMLALTACSSSGSPTTAETAAPDAKIALMTWGDAKYANNEFALYKSNFPEDAQQQTLNVIVGGQNDGDVVNKFRLALSSGTGIPDIVELNYSEVAEFASQGQLADIQTYVSSNLPAMSQAAKTLMQYDGKYVAFPYEVKSKLWYYRKDMFTAAGIDVTQVKTQADFIAAGKNLQAKYPTSYMWNLAASPQAYILGEITSGNGSKIYDQSAKKFVVASDPGIAQAFKALKDLRSSGVVNPNFDDFTPDWQKALADGTVASVPIASWFTTFLPQYAPDGGGKWGVTTWPVIGGAQGGSEAGGSVFVIPAKASNKLAAAKFLASVFMTTKGSTAAFKQSGEIPNVVEAQSDPAVVNNTYYGPDLMNAFKAADADYKLFPYDPASSKEQTILQNALAKYLASDAADPTNMLQEAQDQMTSQIGDPYQQ
jgi:ABC-type glycerol-3-phosphate transport system substrate-binding protein